jgi:Retrotransposon gag protein.
MVQLRAAFQPPNYQQHLRQQLKQLKQTGSVHEYGVQFRNIIGQILNMEELDKVSYFIDGLKAATKMEVNYQAPETFEDAWKLAIHYDTAMFGLGKPGNGKFSSFFSSSSFPLHIENFHCMT